MEVIPQDPQLAHEFCKFLGEKLKDMKALLDAAVQENELLRREIHTLRREPRHLTNQDRMYSGDEKPQLEVGCREGSCPSAHEVQLLQERNQELEELLNSQSVAHEAKTDEMKEKLEAAISKYKECKLKLRTCRQELQNNKGLPEAPRDENIEIRNKEIDETARGKLRNDRVHPDDTWAQLSAKPCLPPHCSTPHHLPPGIKDLMGEGIMFFPGRTVFSSNGRDGTILAGHRKYNPSTQNIKSSWVINKELTHNFGKIWELFYSSEGGVYYAGTFRCTVSPRQMSRASFLDLSETTRQQLFPYIFNCPLQAVPLDEHLNVVRMYQQGKVSVSCIRVRRIGFNWTLIDALALNAAKKPVPVPIPIPSNSNPDSRKRKYGADSSDSQVAAPSKKTKK